MLFYVGSLQFDMDQPLKDTRDAHPRGHAVGTTQGPPGYAGTQVDYDDFLVALPERDHLNSFTKEVPLFLRYLKAEGDGNQTLDSWKGA